MVHDYYHVHPFEILSGIEILSLSTGNDHDVHKHYAFSMALRGVRHTSSIAGNSSLCGDKV
jgi:hypothetical protein